VLTGAAVGTTIGLGLPWLLHYRHGDLSEDDSSDEAVLWRVMPQGIGLGITGMF